MSEQTRPRVVIVVPNWQDANGLLPDRSPREVEARLKHDILSWLQLNGPRVEGRAAANLRVDYLASNMSVPRGIDLPREALRQGLVCGLIMDDEEAVAALAAIIHDVYGDDASIGADLPVVAVGSVEHDRFWTHWCPGEASSGVFGDRAAALRAIGGLPLPGPHAVNIVFVDTGLPISMLPPPGAFQGWEVTLNYASGDITVRKPGEPLTGHGAMVARNARAVAGAPKVRLLDCPIIPDGIMNLPEFLGFVIGAIRNVSTVVKAQQDLLAKHGLPPESWVICNAWGVYDPTRESPSVPYADNPNHPAAIAFRELAALGTDIVFAAGNCGEFCPNHRCSPIHIGPGRSIHGVNAMAEVLTVGAVRSDGLWLGYSAQGPGITNMAHDKPDLCAPSQFDDDDGFGPNTGTSAACGLAAGAVALLRTRAPPAVALRAILLDTADQPYGPQGWQERTGHGVINLAKAAAALPSV